MRRRFYGFRTMFRDGVFFQIIILCGVAILAGLIIWIVLNSSDRSNFIKYKKYEAVIVKKQDALVNQLEAYSKDYTDGKIGRRQAAQLLRKGAKELDKLYKQFKWKRGDKVTRELYTIRRQIIIINAQIYENRAKSVLKGIKYGDSDDINFIKTLQDRYKLKGDLERQRFNIPIALSG